MSAPAGQTAVRQRRTTLGSPAGAAAGWQRWWPYALIALVTFYCHWFILTNDGPIWDGWYWQYWLEHKRWAPMIEYTHAQGLPYTLWAFAPFAYVPKMIPTAMCASFLCLVAEGFLIYILARRLAVLPRGEALTIALLAQALPVFTAAQDFPVFGLIVFRTLFYVSVLLAALAIDRAGPWHWVLRGAALAGFYFSCVTNGALLVFYGAAWLLFLFHYRRAHRLPLWPAARSFILRYPDLFLVPPAVYAARTFFIPQFGWYDTYNQPGANLPFIHEAFGSFFENVIPYHVRETAVWFWRHPIATVFLAGALFLWWKKSPPQLAMRRGRLTTAQYLWFGAVALFFAVLPLAAGGKFFDPEPVGEASRHCMLTGIPFAVLLFGLVRSATFWKATAPSRMLPAVIGVLIIVSGARYWPGYLRERVETIYSQAGLQLAGRSEEIRRSSILQVGGISAVKQRMYGTAVFAGLFGDQTRLVSPIASRYDLGYLPSETEYHSLCTSVIPEEFNRIDPGGQQVLFEFRPDPGPLTPADLAWRDVQTRWFGSAEERERFLAPLVTLRMKVTRRGEPLVPAQAPPAPSQSGTITNSLGLTLVETPLGMWVGKYEVTQGQFESIMGHNPSLFRDPWRPVECVTWHDAVEFCRRLNEREAARLPAEFRYRLPTGEEFDRFVADAWQKPFVAVLTEIVWRTEGVGTKPANQFGLHDTTGNVWEWCLDWWEEDQRHKISKGGAFSSEADQLDPGAWKFVDRTFPVSRRVWLTAVSADRLMGRVRRSYPDQGYWNRGFRVVLAGPAREPMKPAVLRERPAQ